MDHIGIDLHKRESQIRIETERGEIIEKRSAPSGSDAPLVVRAASQVSSCGQERTRRDRRSQRFRAPQDPIDSRGRRARIIVLTAIAPCRAGNLFRGAPHLRVGRPCQSPTGRSSM